MFSESFLFIESPCFESIESNYFMLVYQPVNAEELHEAYIDKIDKCIEILAIISTTSDLEMYLSQFIQMNSNKG
jgi:hypothetical protein